MAKDKVTLTLSPDVLAVADSDARAAGLNRSQWVERVLQRAHSQALMAEAGRRMREQAVADPVEWQSYLAEAAVWEAVGDPVPD